MDEMQHAQNHENSAKNKKGSQDADRETRRPSTLTRIARALMVGTCFLTAYANEPASGGSHDDDDDPTLGDFSDKDIPLGDCDIGTDDCVDTDGFPETPGAMWQDTEGDSSAVDDEEEPEPFD